MKAYAQFDPVGDYSQHEKVRMLVEAAIARLEQVHGAGFREFRIFVQVLGDTPDTSRRLYEYLHDVSTCPPEVIRWCQEELNKAR